LFGKRLRIALKIAYCIESFSSYACVRIKHCKKIRRLLQSAAEFNEFAVH